MTEALTCPNFLDGRGCGHIQPIDGDLPTARALLRDHLSGLHGGLTWSKEEVDRAVRHARPRDLENVLSLRNKARQNHLARRGW
ncbi:hypothetical protein [Streptomyces cinnamoneus]|uniref:hypothetical protein n=1 Tax=Streptomyces cinnamoneus TaxID=53446 RepID=UPI000CEF3418|nr:hypothetical protein [Streptomyces cinnamoneus]PPT14790.1 hypothetical protein CYQ11_19635 [Streptomyces cinnamoneus]